MSVNLVKQWFPQLLTALDRAPMAGLVCAAALLFGVTLAWSRSAAAPNNTTSALRAGVSSQALEAGQKVLDNDKTLRHREGGQIINQSGYFHNTGDRVSFVSADNESRFITLENSHLERVTQTIADSANQLEWVVSGTISEYGGANFLMLNRAELKNPDHSPAMAK
jgi:hypothetical protein